MRTTHMYTVPLLLGLLGFAIASTPDFTRAPPQNISELPRSSLFYHWRPRSHFIHPSDQLGDPTAFWQDPSTNTTHVTALYSYISGTGNDSLSTSGFSGSTTQDFLEYTDLTGWRNPVQLGPGNEVDFIADFDGSVAAKGYKGLPTLIWTAVKGLPISWTIPYKDGYESQGLAYSENEGKSWIKLNGGANTPVIPRPPYSGNVVTGFRDPYIFENAQFDRLLNLTTGEEEKMNYVTLSSGLHPAQPGLPGVEFDEAGPRVWLYRQTSPSSWLDWTFCGPLLRSEINTTFVTPGSGWAGTDYSDGNNYETSQITNLDYSGDASFEGRGLGYISYGAESNKTLMLYRLGYWKRNEGVNTTPVNASLAPGVIASNKGVELDTSLEGVLDWGLAYACTGVRDASRNKPRRIVYCWIKEAFADQDATKFVTGYISSLTLPRELFVKKIRGVVNDNLVLQNASWAILNDTSPCDSISTIPAEEFQSSPARKNATVDLVMLGIKPAEELEAFRSKANASYHHADDVIIDVQDFATDSACLDGTKPSIRRGIASGNPSTLVDELYIPLPHHPSSPHFEFSTTIRFGSSSLRSSSSFAAGISFLRTPSTHTSPEDLTLIYQPSNESVILQKRTSLTPTSVSTTPEIGKLRLWQLSSNRTEPLHLRVFVDGSAMEIYINERFVMTTRAYYWYTDSRQIGFAYQIPHNASVNSTSADMQVTFSNTSWWEGLIDAYPKRPKDKEQLLNYQIGYPEPQNNPNAQGIIYNGTGPSPPFPDLD